MHRSLLRMVAVVSLLCVGMLAAGAAALASLQVPSYPAPQFATPVANAYAWVAALSIDFSTGTGAVTVYVHPNAAAASALLPPIDVFRVALGETLVPAKGQTPAITFPTLPQLQTAAAQAVQANPALDPFTAMRLVIYQNLVNHPKLAGSTAVP